MLIFVALGGALASFFIYILLRLTALLVISFYVHFAGGSVGSALHNKRN
jgi:hypothetical protein